MRWLLTCDRTGRFWWHDTEAAARRAGFALKDYTISKEVQQ